MTALATLLDHAAELLEGEIDTRVACETCDGEWDDPDAKAEHDDLAATAAALRSKAASAALTAAADSSIEDGLRNSLHNAQTEIARQASVIVRDTSVCGQIIAGNERRIGELEDALHRISAYGGPAAAEMARAALKAKP